MKNSSTKIFLSILGVAILVLSVIGFSFAAIELTRYGSKENTIMTGSITMTYNEGTAINITNALPISDDVGKNLSGENEKFIFTVSANIVGNASINYEIAAIKKDPATHMKQIEDENVRLYLTKLSGGVETEVMAPSPFVPSTTVSNLMAPVGSMILTTGSYPSTASDTYILRMWLKEGTLIEEAQSYTVTVNVYAAAA